MFDVAVEDLSEPEDGYGYLHILTRLPSCSEGRRADR